MYLLLLGMAIGVAIAGLFERLYVDKLREKQKIQAIHDHVQYMYDREMLSTKGNDALKYDVEINQYAWKL